VRTCVIGGAGFIGTHLVRLLAESGRDVVVLGRRAQPDAALPHNAKYVSGDYGDRAALKGLLRRGDEIVDLAYATVPQTSFADPIYDILANLPASVQLLQEAVEAQVSKVVLVSTGGAVYGSARKLPIDEEHPTLPISPYGITKLTIEKYAGMFHHVSELPVAIARPGNAYGEGQRPFAGQGFIATAIHSIIRGDAVRVFGTEGTVRDYVHVSDVASGILAVLQEGEPGEAYNIGTAVGASNIDVLRGVEPLAALAGFEVRVERLPARSFDVATNVLDSRKLSGVSGWKPRIALQDGLERVWRAALDSLKG